MILKPGQLPPQHHPPTAPQQGANTRVRQEARAAETEALDWNFNAVAFGVPHMHGRYFRKFG